MGRTLPRIGAGHDISCPYEEPATENRDGWLWQCHERLPGAMQLGDSMMCEKQRRQARRTPQGADAQQRIACGIETHAYLS